MHCRMCSQRLTRPGRLCRECEHELDRARVAAASLDNLSSALPLIDAARPTDAEAVRWTERLRSRPTLMVAAFSVGIASALVLYLVQPPHAAGRPESVMIDRDLSKIRPRDVRAPASVRLRVEDRAVADASGAAARGAAHVVEHRPPVLTAMAATGARPAGGDAGEPLASHPAGSAASQPEAAPYDRVLGLADALDTCSHQPMFTRVACEQRARMRYCADAGASQIPQCAEPPPREYGQ